MIFSIGGKFKVNNRYQEMSGIMINESFNGILGDGGRSIENKHERQHLIIKTDISNRISIGIFTGINLHSIYIWLLILKHT
jgi:hypothetical protein